MRCESGQSTLEYALLLMASLAMVGALGLVWHAARDGVLVELASEAASHVTAGDLLAWLQDLMGF